MVSGHGTVVRRDAPGGTSLLVTTASNNDEEAGLALVSCHLWGPVHAVEETEAEVIILAAFSLLASTEVTMELAGDRLLIQGKSPCASPKPGMGIGHPEEGRYDMRIRSAVLPCAVDLARASVMRKNDMVRIILPKKARGHRNRIGG